MENLLNKINHVVIKVGSNAITSKSSVNRSAIRNIALATSDLMSQGKKVSIVTSGAIAAGRRLTKGWKLESLPEKQMLAAIGQPVLMQEYINLFSEHNLYVAQFLLSKTDFEDTSALERLRSCFIVSLDRKIIPVINENDPVATHEIKFSDNDELQALVVRELGGDLGINLITYNGLMKDGDIVSIAEKYGASEYDNLSKEVKEGRGGLQGKLNAMHSIVLSGKYGIIGNVSGDIIGMIKGKELHTRFYPIRI